MDTNERNQERTRRKPATDPDRRGQRPDAAPSGKKNKSQPERRKAAEGTAAQRPAARAEGAKAATEKKPRPEQKTPAAQRTAQQRKETPKDRAAAAPAPKRNPAQSGKKKAAAKQKRPTDAQYQPYKAAEKRKKAARAVSVQKFFSAQNPVVSFAANTGKKLGAKRKRDRKAKNTPAVIYTQPAPFNRNRLLIQLITVIAVVVALIMGLSVFFKVKTITVTGAEVYSPWAVREASGITEGVNLLTFGRAKASGQITANLPYVKSVRIGIKLPDTVNIEIEEEDVVYAIRSEDGIWWLINSDGKVVEMTTGGNASNYTKVVGVTLTSPRAGERGEATEELPTETNELGEFIPLTVTGQQRLDAALSILKLLEANDIVGEAASVEVGNLDDVILWYGTRYQVNLGNMDRMDYKLACMADAILQMSDYQTGILDVSFQTWENQVGYTPFE